MLELRGISKCYTTSHFSQTALDHISVCFRDNEFVSVLGPSGSGKTTLLNIVGGLDHFDEGDLIIDGISTKKFKDRDWDAYRNNRIGFVFQSYNLIPHQTVLANVEIALTLAGVGRSERRSRAKKALEQVGLAEHINKKPSQLSGGQMQRVAIARALVNDPEILLADEPTGALDSHTSIQVMELLKEVARDRLVIMVTHNPELAHRYSTRIVELSDGHITADSDPFDPATVAQRVAKPSRKTKMSFLTALGLSFTNLMSKKGRTAMTAFAGSIGIIGIAAILSLATGVNDYIDRVEEETLSSYPLSITTQGYDFSALMSGEAFDVSEIEENAAQNPGAERVKVVDVVQRMFSSVTTNDLSGLKSYFESGTSGIEDEVNAIVYNYGIDFYVYGADTTEAVVCLSPTAMENVMVASSSSAALTGTSTSIFNEMMDNTELLQQQYNLVAGTWPEAADECIVVLTQGGFISDYLLYGVGILNPDELEDMISAALSANAGELEVDNSGTVVTYDDLLSLSFKVVSPADTYRKNEETGGWTDMSDDDDFMKDAVDAGLDLHVVGIVEPSETSSSSALSAGIAYTHALTEALIQRAESSAIVRQQMADPDTDVFTGSSFSDLQEDAKAGVDMENIFSIDEDILAQAFSFDTSSLSIDFDASSISLDGMNFDLDLDLSGMSFSADTASLLSGLPTPDVSELLEEIMADPGLSDEEKEAVTQDIYKLMAGFFVWWMQNGGVLADPSSDAFTGELAGAMAEYLATEDAQVILGDITEVAGEGVTQRLQEILNDYVQNTMAPYLASAMQSMMEDMMVQLSAAVSAQIQSAMVSMMASYADAIASAMASSMSSLQSQLADAFSFDADAFASAISFNMDAEDLASLMASYANASSLTYENNLSTLGYADIKNPVAISIYPKDFDAKERVVSIIDTYNELQKAADNEDGVVTYTDYVGLLMSSVTDIINKITMVLIAFVSISLVVSSIMIGIVTYISVLERKKEIGVLRAVGASKGNIASVFNAETFIEGLLSGVIAIGVVLAASVPVNALVLEHFQVEGIMHLPLGSAAALIGVSVVLTLVAGLIPSSAASRRDPVEALRSE